MVKRKHNCRYTLWFYFYKKTLLFFVEMATKGYATLKGAVSVTQRKKHSSSQMSIVTPTSIYSIHRPPKIEIMFWHCFYVKRHTYCCTCNKGWCVMDAHRLWSDMPSASSSQCLCDVLMVKIPLLAPLSHCCGPPPFDWHTRSCAISISPSPTTTCKKM